MVIVKLVFMTTNSIFTNLVNVPETVSVLGPSSHQIMATTLGRLQASARTLLGPKVATSVFPCAHLRPVFYDVSNFIFVSTQCQDYQLHKTTKTCRRAGPLSHALRAEHWTATLGLGTQLGL